MNQQRVLIDASNLHSGGGVQVAASFINELFDLSPSPAWLRQADIWASSAVHENLDSEKHHHVRLVDSNPSAEFLLARRTRYDVAFSIFGPTYRRSLAKFELAGFADPTVPPGYAPHDALGAGSISRLVKTWVKRSRIRSLDHVVVETRAFAASLQKFGVPASKVSVVPNAVSCAILQRAQSGPPQPLGSGGRVTLLYPGRLYPHKNHSFLGRLHRELAIRGISAAFLVTLTPSELQTLDSSTRSACTPIGVLTQAQLAEQYGRAQGVIFPTLLEVASATPIEALSVGLPFFGSDRDFVREQAGAAGWYFDPADPVDAADQISAALQNPQAVAHRSALGRQIAHASPTSTQRAERYVALIDQYLLEGKGEAANKTSEIIVAHPAQQHSMRTAAAVKRAGYCLNYVTTVYDRPRTLTRSIKHLLRGEDKLRASNRRSPELDHTEVTQVHELMGLVLLFLQRLPWGASPFMLWFRIMTSAFNKRLTRMVENSPPLALICYDTFAAAAFEAAQRRNPEVIRILDMSAPAIPFVASILRDEVVSAPHCSLTEQLREELKSAHFRASVAYTWREIRRADHFLVASTLTAASLKTLGVAESRIHICRYGSPTIPQVEAITTTSVPPRPLRVVFVGRVTAQKGAHVFLDLAGRLSPTDYSFLVIGPLGGNSALAAQHPRVRFTGNLTHGEVLERLQECDVMIFPSLADGFGLAVLEAMASGVAVICSVNAGAADLIQDGQNGYVVEPRDRERMLGLLRLLRQNPALLRNLQCAAILTAQERSWARYDADIAAALQRIVSLQLPR